MSAVRFEAKGFKELERALVEELPKATAKNTMRRAAIESMEPVLDRARQLAPRDKGVLAEKIVTKVVRAKRQKGSARFAAQSGVTVATGPTSRRADDPGGNAAWQEEGTVNMPANPYMRPAADSELPKVLDRLKERLAVQIGKARARIAKKAARGK